MLKQGQGRRQGRVFKNLEPRSDSIGTEKALASRQNLHDPASKPARAVGSGGFLFTGAGSIAVADIDHAVGGPFPATVINMEVMAMPVVMAMMTMPVMAMAVPVMAVMAVASMSAVPTVTVAAASKRLTRDGQGGSGQRQSRDSGRDDLSDPSH
jgi:hypothetical protein